MRMPPHIFIGTRSDTAGTYVVFKSWKDATDWQKYWHKNNVETRIHRYEKA